MDAGRLDALGAQLGETPAAVAGTLHAELQRALVQIDAGLAEGDVAAVGRAVHAARNSVLMLDDAPMLAALRALDEAVTLGEDARAVTGGGRDGDAAGTARATLEAEWRRLGAALRAAADG